MPDGSPFVHAQAPALPEQDWAWIIRHAERFQLASEKQAGWAKIAKACVDALGVAVTLVTPAKWKATLRVPADKSASRQRAAQLWPGLAGTFARVKDDGRAEAAMIGLYGANTLHGVAA